MAINLAMISHAPGLSGAEPNQENDLKPSQATAGAPPHAQRCRAVSHG